MKENTFLSHMNFFSRFFQVAYITTDLQESIKIFGELYGVHKFMVPSQPIKKQVIQNGKVVNYTLKLAFARVGDHQLELIEPMEDETGVYLPLLPASGFGQLFHHLACCFTNQQEWDDFRSSLDTEKHPIAFENVEGETPFLYLDERKNLGHYFEYMWLEPKQWDAMFNQLANN